MTYLQMVNFVLRKLREDEVTSYNETDYSKLISDFINEAKREVEDAWDWTALRQTITVNCVASTQSYTLTGAGERYKIFHVMNDTEDAEMKIAPYDWIHKQMAFDTQQEASPTYFNIEGTTSGDPDVNFWPVPNAADVIKFDMKIPQDDLSSSNTELTVPYWPVQLGAYAKALSDRGEDGSTQYAEAMSQYVNALADAISLDAARVPHETVWNVC